MVSPALKNLVLVGGGHSHVFVLKSLGMKPLAGLQVTLVTRDILTPYSGMLPGYVAGLYSHDQCHIDLAQLATFANARLVHDTCVSIDPNRNQVGFKTRPPLTYDCLSIDIGITPNVHSTPGIDHVTPVKPIDGFVKRFDSLLSRARSLKGDLKVVVVGGGAGGVELAFAVHHRLTQTPGFDGLQPPQSGGGHAYVTLVTGGDILSSHPRRARRLFLDMAEQRGIAIKEGARVASVEQGAVLTQCGERIDFDECLWCTQAAPASWLQACPLPKTEGGFLAINEFLQSAGGPSNVFAAGDVATSICDPRPKAGVFAVRQGPPLADNIRRFLTGQALKPFKPQRDFLGIISTGDRSAVATRGSIAFSGDWLWRWKDQIDCKFMRSFSEDLPGMHAELGPEPEVLQGDHNGLRDVWQLAHMRCKGCAAKVPPNALQHILQELKLLDPDSAVSGLAGVPLAQDDAAVLPAPAAGMVSVQTVDVLSSLVDDPYMFGRIAAVHALSDCFAMGAQPTTALAVVQVEHAAPDVVISDLRQMMHGAAAELQGAGCALVGGHSSEGSEATLGFSITGHAEPDALMLKSRVRPGEKLVLTKRLGTGVLLRGAMLRKAHGEQQRAAWQSMLQSNQGAGLILQKHGVQACTDVTGFGLLGHCVEMAQASQVNLQINVSSIPALPGVEELLEDGVESTAVASNRYYLQYINHGASTGKEACTKILLDPQTSGGLLFSIPGEQCVAVLSDLHEAGYCATVIGEATTGDFLASSPVQMCLECLTL